MWSQHLATRNTAFQSNSWSRHVKVVKLPKANENERRKEMTGELENEKEERGMIKSRYRYRRIDYIGRIVIGDGMSFSQV